MLSVACVNALARRRRSLSRPIKGGEARAGAPDTEIMSATITVATISCALPGDPFRFWPNAPHQFPTVTLLTDGVHPVAAAYFVVRVLPNN